jgi:glycosyltransferase involved in cell wall biosynthesis
MEADIFAASRLRKFLKEQKAQILHAHTGHAVGLGALAALSTETAFLATRRVDFPIRTNFFSRWKYGQLDGLVTISRRVQQVVGSNGFVTDRIAVIPSGIDPSEYPSTADRLKLRKARGFSERDVLVVNAAALVPHKDHETLLRAAAIVCRAVPAARFLILGDGPLRGALAGMAQAMGLAEKVFFLGHRADVLELMAMADVFAFSSVEEGLGTSLLDALTIGVPTAATAAGGIPEIYGSSSAPELVPPRDPQALAENILVVLRDPAEARRRVERGRDLVKGFSVQAMAERYEEVYKNLLT